MTKTEMILFDNFNNISKEYSKLKQEQVKLPKGSLQKKTINGRTYNYLQYRSGKNVCTDYIATDKLSGLVLCIERRKNNEIRIKELEEELIQIHKVLKGRCNFPPEFTAYKLERNIDYEEYTRYMSYLAHELKRLGKDEFVKKYSGVKKTGLEGKYLKGLIHYVGGKNYSTCRSSLRLVLDPYTYHMYFDYNMKGILQASLKRAIPEFLQQGLLITEVQEAVNSR